MNCIYSNIFERLPDEILLRITRHAYTMWLYDSLAHLDQIDLAKPDSDYSCLCSKDPKNNIIRSVVIKDKANFIRVYNRKNKKEWSLVITFYSSNNQLIAGAKVLQLSLMPIIFCFARRIFQQINCIIS